MNIINTVVKQIEFDTNSLHSVLTPHKYSVQHMRLLAVHRVKLLNSLSSLNYCICIVRVKVYAYLHYE